ncbi:DNA-directed RNA polymerase, mitochondrial [Trichomonascus vanleenenianus]|uniref:DNA-directed RNA polymerase, mitochondrial n=1 Tax=Trichomonascus vanleenenianus TaxID=2268995 RepID=UPI003ECAE5E7
MGGTIPSTAIAYALHCCVKQNNREGVNKIVDLWTLKLSQSMRQVYCHSDVIPATEVKAVEDILNDKDLLELSRDFYDPKGFSELRSCLAIVREPRLDVNKIIGTNFGNDKYFEIYDKLDDKKKEIFDRAYEMFNRDRQRDIELFGFTPADERVKDTSAISKLTFEWKDALEKVLNKVMQQSVFVRHRKPSGLKALAEKLGLPEDTLSTLCEHRELLSKVGADGVAKVITQEMIMLSLSFLDTKKGESYRISGRPFTSMARRLGGAIVNAAKVPEYSTKSNQTLRDTNKDALRRQYTEMYWNRFTGAQKMDTVSMISLGVAVINLCLDRMKLPFINETGEVEHKPAFWKGYEQRGHKKYGHIYVNEDIVELAIKDRSKAIDLVRSAYYLPMLVKPRPWTSNRDGGYLYADSTLLSSNVPIQMKYIQKAIERGQMDKFLAGIDVISSTPWAINDRVFKVIDELWTRGEGSVGIPSRQDPGKRAVTKRQKQLHLGKLLERTAFGIALEVAKAYSVNGERFYFPHQVDFRGRAYPICSAGLTYLGQESYRALFQFWHGKKLGASGLRWLKIQLANMYGYDKVSNDDRVKFADEHMKSIMDSADRPLEGAKWWMSGDKPFQVLAACFEITDAMRSPDPSQFISRIPVNQDGSCNGLQHYAALGGDTAGARQVNMLPAEKPGDIYSQIAKSVNELIDEDCRNGMAGVDKRFHEIASIINGRIVRKIVKQSVMTTVYGVTQYGATLQVKKQLELIPELPREMYGLAASYVSGKIFKARTLMFKGASQLQDWLVDGAARICESMRFDVYKNALKPAKRADNPLQTLDMDKAFTTGVVWTTPLGLPVVQPYAKEETMVINVDSHYLTLLRGDSSPVNKNKQKNGVAPNFVHSLDATHMLMTAQECNRRGIAFASVHDSYWTHAASVDDLSRVLREQFVSLYSVNQIERLREEWIERYSGFLNLGSVTPEMKCYEEIKQYRDDMYGRQSLKSILLDELEVEYRTWLRKRVNKKYLNMPPTPTRYLRKHREKPVPLTNRTLKVLYPIAFPMPPQRGNYEAASVLDSEYFFS